MRLALLALAALLLPACPGRGEESRSAPAAGARAPVPHSVRPVLSGIVRDEARHPVEGAEVRAFLPWGGGTEGLKGLTARTDREGAFAIDIEGAIPDVDPRAPVILTIRAEGFVTMRSELPTFRPGIGRFMEAVLRRAGAVSGRVLTVEGKPVPGALVYVIPPTVAGVEQAGMLLSATTGSDGSFEIPGISPGGYDVGVRAPGCVNSLRGPVAIEGGKTADAGILRVRPGGSISGTVLTPAGEPVAGARVFAFRNPAFRRYVLPGRAAVSQAGGFALTDAKGRFALRSIPPESSFTVAAEAPGYRTVDAQAAEVRAGRNDLRFVLEREASVVLIVVDAATTKAVPAFEVAVIPAGGANPVVDARDVRERAKVHSPAGTWQFAARPGIVYQVEVAAEGYQVAVRRIGPVEEGTVKRVRLVLFRRGKRGR